MQLSDILSSAQIGAMRSVATAPALGAKYAPELSRFHETIYELGSQSGAELSVTFWRDLRDEFREHSEVMIRITGKTAIACSVQHTHMFARQMGEFLKQGDVLCWLRSTGCIAITWDNWSLVYAHLTETPVKRDYDPYVSQGEMQNIKRNKKRDGMFYDMALSDRYKKMGKRGFSLSFDEHKARYMQEKYEKELRATIVEARAIMKVV